LVLRAKGPDTPSFILIFVFIDEIQVYTDDINPVGKFGLELHVNTTPAGRSRPDYPGEITPQHGLRLTPEFSYGLSHDFEAGLYVPLERTGDGMTMSELSRRMMVSNGNITGLVEGSRTWRISGCSAISGRTCFM